MRATDDGEESPWTGWANAEAYDRFIREHPIYRWLNRELVAVAAIAEAERVLDLACGTGATTRACLAPLPARGVILGVDASPAMVEVARARVGDPRARFAVAAASEVASVAASTGPFDRVVCNAAFWQFPDPTAVLGALRRLLVPGGRVAFNVPASRMRGESTPVHPFQVALARAVRERGGGSAAGGEVGGDEVSPAALEAALDEAGFDLLSARKHAYHGSQRELMELMEIPAMLHRAAPHLSIRERRAALLQARSGTDPDQEVEVPWIFWTAAARPERADASTPPEATVAPARPFPAVEGR